MSTFLELILFIGVVSILGLLALMVSWLSDIATQLKRLVQETRCNSSCYDQVELRLRNINTYLDKLIARVDAMEGQQEPKP